MARYLRLAVFGVVWFGGGWHRGSSPASSLPYEYWWESGACPARPSADPSSFLVPVPGFRLPVASCSVDAAEWLLALGGLPDVAVAPAKNPERLVEREVAPRGERRDEGGRDEGVKDSFVVFPLQRRRMTRY